MSSQKSKILKIKNIILDKYGRDHLLLNLETIE